MYKFNFDKQLSQHHKHYKGYSWPSHCMAGQLTFIYGQHLLTHVNCTEERDAHYHSLLIIALLIDNT